MPMKTKELYSAIAESRKLHRSHWARGVHDVANTLVYHTNKGDDEEITIYDVANHVRATPQNIHSFELWKKIAWGGIALCYWNETVNTLYSPSERKKFYTKDEQIKESMANKLWNDRDRAVYQAAMLIKRLIKYNGLI